MKRFREWLNIQLVKKPGGMVLFAILLFNVVFFLLSALIISALSTHDAKEVSFLVAAYYTVAMVLDAGFVSSVSEIGTSGVVLTLFCLIVVLVGMITFTGAVIGYVTNYISHFIESANSGKRRLVISGHVVILNWNTRASEIVNDLLYCDKQQKVVVLVSSRKAEIEKEIDERLSDTIARENKATLEKYAALPFFRRRALYRKERMQRNVTVIVREGDVFSSKQLHDIALEHAKCAIILGNDINNTICKFEHKDRLEEHGRGNAQTIKTLMQVADITAAAYSDDDQKIIVEVTEDWTAEIVDKIIRSKQVDGKCNIVPVRVNKVLGQILSQFCLMPELNAVYRELFSNKGAAFYSHEETVEDDTAHAKAYLAEHKHAIPLTFMKDGAKNYYFYAADSEKDIAKKSVLRAESAAQVKLNRNYWIVQKNVVILGHNTKCRDIMQGFASFCSEWGTTDKEILRILVIDDPKNLEKLNYYKDYPFVVETVAANLYEKDKICSTIERFALSNEEDTSVLILSDDTVLNEDLDAGVLTNLVYVQDIINKKVAENPDFDPESIDVIVEILDPKHHDVVNGYSVNNVVISNRYISKMITQIGEKEAIFNFYSDILTYDEEGATDYDSKEIYVKKVSRFFEELPAPCTAEEFIRGVFYASSDESIPKEKRNPNIPLGYVKPGGRIVLFSGDQAQTTVHLEEKDKIIVFSNH